MPSLRQAGDPAPVFFGNECVASRGGGARQFHVHCQGQLLYNTNLGSAESCKG